TVVNWLTKYNFPGAKPPRVYRITDPDEDLNQRAERDKQIYDMGFKPSLKHITDEYGGEWGERNETPPPRDAKPSPTDAPTDEPTDAPTEPEQPLDTGALDSVQQAALNGAQIKSLSDVIALVQQGQLDRERAYALIEVGFPAISNAQIERLLGDAVA